MYMYMRINLPIYMYIHICMCVCVFVYMYTHTHTHTHTHTFLYALIIWSTVPISFFFNTQHHKRASVSLGTGWWERACVRCGCGAYIGMRKRIRVAEYWMRRKILFLGASVSQSIGWEQYTCACGVGRVWMEVDMCVLGCGAQGAEDLD